MSSNPEVSVIIPVLNEEDSIGIVLDKIAISGLKSFEIIVVDGGSVDGTLEIIEKKNIDNVIKGAHGYMNSLLLGTKASKGDFVVWIDGDNTYNPMDIHNILIPLKENRADYVIGSRIIGVIMPGKISFFKKN